MKFRQMEQLMAEHAARGRKAKQSKVYTFEVERPSEYITKALDITTSVQNQDSAVPIVTVWRSR